MADILGHKTIQMTMRYTHPSTEHKAETMQRIEGHGLEMQEDISDERKALRQLVAKAIQIIDENGPDAELFSLLSEISPYQPNA